MLADDEEFDRLTFRRLVDDAGARHPLREFASGGELMDGLIEVLRGAMPPLVCFVDVKRAGMSGFDVLRGIRCQRPLDDVPVVMLSSSDAPGDLNDALHYGAQCYLAKFPDAAQLRQIIQEAETVADTNTRPFKLACNLLLSSTAAFNHSHYV